MNSAKEDPCRLGSPPASANRSALDIVSEVLTLIAKDGPKLGCFIESNSEQALLAARDSDNRRSAGGGLGILDGIPFAVKANIAVSGLSWNAGLAARHDVVANEDAWIVARCRDLGAIPIGTTNMAEAAIGAITANPTFGVCVNPLDHEKSAGGSSGGSACAVAAGFVPFALGTDTLGSVRIPAAYCGIAGWKPSRGMIPNVGVIPLSAALDTVGILARSAKDISDVAETLGIIRGPIDPTFSNRLIVPLAALERPIEEAVRRSFEGSLKQLEGLGHTVRMYQGSLPDLGRIRRLCLLICEVEAYRYYEPLLDRDPEGFSEEVRYFLNYGGRVTPQKVADAVRELRSSIEELSGLFEENDAVILPTTPYRACSLDSSGDAGDADLTGWVNALGVPSISIPMWEPDANKTELPSGLQIVGRPWADHTVLAVAVGLERGIRE